MTDNDIIKAYEHCYINGKCCDDCPADILECAYIEALFYNLFSRKSIENEVLKEEIAFKGRTIEYAKEICDELRERLAKSKAEAVKEFAERLKECSQWLPLIAMPDPFVAVSDIDNLVKEMVGDTE